MLPQPRRRLFLRRAAKTFPYTRHHLFTASEKDKDEEALEGVQDKEDIPDRLNIQTASHQARSPAQPHEGGESQVESETCLRSTRCDLRRAVRRLPHQAGGVDEEQQVESEHYGEGDDEVDHQRCSRPKPADADGRAAKLRSVLLGQLRQVEEVEENGDSDKSCRCEPTVHQVATEPAPLSS